MADGLVQSLYAHGFDEVIIRSGLGHILSVNDGVLTNQYEYYHSLRVMRLLVRPDSSASFDTIASRHLQVHEYRGVGSGHSLVASVTIELRDGFVSHIRGKIVGKVTKCLQPIPILQEAPLSSFLNLVYKDLEVLEAAWQT